jgi:site-specific recombinase XerD
MTPARRPSPRSFLHAHVLDFLALRKALGKSVEGWDYAFQGFERFLLDERVPSLDDVDTQLLLRWLGWGPSRTAPKTRNRKLVMLRTLFRHLVRRGHCERDPTESLPKASEERVLPYVFTHDELERVLLEVPRTIGPKLHRYLSSLYQTLFLLLYAGGLRVSEGLRLRFRHLDFEEQTLRIEKTKFRKSRLVPLEDPVVRVLSRFLEVRRGRFGPPGPDDFLFLSIRLRRTPLLRCTVGDRLRLVLRRLGVYRKTVREQGVVHLSPSVHSLRHSFAVHRLEQWYREGVDVLSKLPFLSTYLGHVHIAHTQHYLTILPDLLREAGRRFARFSDDGDFLRP